MLCCEDSTTCSVFRQAFGAGRHLRNLLALVVRYAHCSGKHPAHASGSSVMIAQGFQGGRRKGKTSSHGKIALDICPFQRYIY